MTLTNKILGMFFLTAILSITTAPLAIAQSGDSSMTADITIEGVCIININTTPIVFGNLASGDTSAEFNAVTVQNAGAVLADITHRGTDFEDGGAVAQIAISDMGFATSALVIHSSKTPMSVSDQSLGTIAGSDIDVWYDVQANLLNAFFTGNIQNSVTVSFLCA